VNHRGEQAATGPHSGQNPARLVYRFGPFELDLDRFELRRQNGVRLRTTPATLNLLILLVQRRGSLVTREEIAGRLWADSSMVDVDQGINTAVNRAREVLRDNASEPRYIETVVGKGYRFIAEVEEAATGPRVVAFPNPRPAAEEPAPTAEASPHADPGRLGRLRRYWPVFSVAGILLLSAVVYATWHYRHKPIRNALSLTQVTTNDSEQRVTAAAISPDGKWLAYADTNGVSLQLLQSRKTTPLKAPAGIEFDRIAWYPDQTRILGSGSGDHLSEAEIWILSITGDAPQLLRKAARNGLPSPDGARIAFTANNDRELWTAGPRGEDARQLATDNTGRVFCCTFWSRDGKSLSYIRRLNGFAGKDLYESAEVATGKALTAISNLDFDSGVELRDGRVFLLRDSPLHYMNSYSLWEAKTGTSGALSAPATKLTTLENGRAFGLTSSDDGTKLSIIFELGQPHVYVASLNPGPVLNDVARLSYDTRTDFPGAWLPDSQTVLFESDRTGIFRLYAQRLQDRTAQEIDTGQGPAVLPQASPDGKWILYVATPKGGPHRLFRIPASGGVPEEVAIGGPVDENRCPLHGPYCVLRETEGQKTFAYYDLDPVKGKGRLLARTAWFPNVLSDWCVAPDGSAVALAIHDSGDPRIRIVPLQTGSTRREYEVPVRGYGRLAGIAWSADGKGWYVAADSQLGTVLLDVNLNGESHVLRRTPLSDWGVPSPDGRKLAFVDRAVDSNVWLWQVDAR
jgi:Tol biopolymer transport system component/DNA-binding winged helix-turn-helix (wHTH) protein